MRYRPLGWFHDPASASAIMLAGLLLTAAALAFVRVDAHSHSVSDTLIGVAAPWAALLFGWEWLAGLACRR